MMVYEVTSSNGGWFDWAYKGVDHSFPGNGGLECRDFLSVSQRCWESVAASIIALLALFFAYQRLRLPQPDPCVYCHKSEPLGKRIFLLLMCLTFGIELGFKFATRQMIWIGNPCHLATMMQIFILAAPPNRIVTAAFRLHMHMLTGAPIAILFPVINTRLLPFETGVYFLQHILLLIIPFYLMWIGDPFIPEPLEDMSWAAISFGFLFIYHFLPLQLLAYVSQVNLNNMLCPAVSDPFHGRFYRLFAICHQLILIFLLGKLFVLFAAKGLKIIPCNNPPDVANVSEAFFCTPTCCCDTVCCSSDVAKQSCHCSPPCDEGECNTDDDSGCVASASIANCGCRYSRTITKPTYCSSHRPNTHINCFSDPKHTNRSYNKENVHTLHIVNGQLVDDGRTDEPFFGKWMASPPSCPQGISETCGSDSNCQHRSFLLNDSQESSPEVQKDQTLHVSDLEHSRNSHAKSH